MHGIDAFEANLDEKLDLAEHAVDRLAEIDPVEVVAEPQLSMLAFRAHPEGLDGEELDAFNEAWMQRVNERGRVHLSGTTLADRFTLRISILSFRTHREHVDHCIEDLRTELEELNSD
jgi:aromatic-L-amino-acid decarboxylase